MFYYLSSFQDWEIAIAKKLVNDHIRKWECLRLVDFEDILWECLSHWHMVKGTYSGEKNASCRTYMGRIIRNKLRDIIRRQTAVKREICQHSISINKIIGEDMDSPTLLEQLSSEPPANSSYSPGGEFDKRIDLENVMRRLNPKQKRLCELLMAEPTITQISKCLETPRSTIYDEIERIRKIFENTGLKDYLE
jgi:RNA polymerase sigma factor (sigma-70 family)